MKYCALFFSILLFMFGKAQDLGIQFEHNTSWEQILLKAKAEKKYIFIDCYTTWCGPCKGMNKNVFPIEKVGKFYNENFINVALQLDTTQEDTEEVKRLYSTSSEIKKKYSIVSYPTYIYFDFNGKAVHKVVGGCSVEDFIIRGKDALDTKKQFYNLKDMFGNGERDSTFLYNTVKISIRADELGFGKKVFQEYFSLQKNHFTKENLELLRRLINSSKDFGFKIMLDNAYEIDSILGEGVSAAIVNRIILNEEIGQELRKNMQPDWQILSLKLESKYPKQANEIIYIAKIDYAERNEDWNTYGKLVKNYLKNYQNKVQPYQLNVYAWQVFLKFTDKNTLKRALRWSKKSFSNQERIDPGYIDTYANILYKLGMKKEAIMWEKEGQRIAIEQGGNTNWGMEVMDKMNKGEKTW